MQAVTAWRESFHAFALRVAERLEKGEESYQGRSFSADPPALLEEIRDELRDVAGWAFVLDSRLARVAAALEHANVTLASETNRYSESSSAPTPGGSRDAGSGPPTTPPEPPAPLRKGS